MLLQYILKLITVVTYCSAWSERVIRTHYYIVLIAILFEYIIHHIYISKQPTGVHNIYIYIDMNK